MAEKSNPKPELETPEQRLAWDCLRSLVDFKYDSNPNEVTVDEELNQGNIMLEFEDKDGTNIIFLVKSLGDYGANDYGINWDFKIEVIPISSEFPIDTSYFIEHGTSGLRRVITDHLKHRTILPSSPSLFEIKRSLEDVIAGTIQDIPRIVEDGREMDANIGLEVDLGLSGLLVPADETNKFSEIIAEAQVKPRTA